MALTSNFFVTVYISHPVFTTSAASYLLLLLLRQPISKLDTHALSLTPWVLDYIEFFRFQTENYCYCSYYLCNELSVTSKSPSIFGDKIFLIVIFIAFGIN